MTSWSPTHRHHKGGYYRLMDRGHAPGDLTEGERISWHYGAGQVVEVLVTDPIKIEDDVVIYDNPKGETFMRPAKGPAGFDEKVDELTDRFRELPADATLDMSRIDPSIARATYYGTKRVEAWPEERPSFPGARDINHGYGIRYPDGYESWSPKDVFEAAYRRETRMGFEGALAAMREGRKVRRLTIDADNVSMWLHGDRILVQRTGSPAGVWSPDVPSILADWTVVE